MSKVFLRAKWEYVAMFNFAVDPAILKPLVPPGTELDFYHDHTFISVVGFRFRQTRILGIAVPFHADFEEVNLRFYVRRCAHTGWRRGVTFIRELVPRRMLALTARYCYGEPYQSLAMRHKIHGNNSNLEVEYAWRWNGQWESLQMEAEGSPEPLKPDSEEEFIAEHYWAFTRRHNECSEYAVEHAPWRIWLASKSKLNGNLTALCGRSPLLDILKSQSSSSFIADGSAVLVRCPRRISVGI